MLKRVGVCVFIFLFVSLVVFAGGNREFLRYLDSYMSKGRYIFKDAKARNSNLKVNINKAGVDELIKIPGIGKTTAQRIVDYRKQNGKFNEISDLLKVKGIGKKSLKKIAPYIVISGSNQGKPSTQVSNKGEMPEPITSKDLTGIRGGDIADKSSQEEDISSDLPAKGTQSSQPSQGSDNTGNDKESISIEITATPDNASANIALNLKGLNGEVLKLTAELLKEGSDTKFNLFMNYLKQNANSKAEIELLLNVVNQLITKFRFKMLYQAQTQEEKEEIAEKLQKLSDARQMLLRKMPSAPDVSGKEDSSAIPAVPTKEFGIVKATPGINEQDCDLPPFIEVKFNKPIARIEKFVLRPQEVVPVNINGNIEYKPAPPIPGHLYITNNVVRYAFPPNFVSYNKTYIVELKGVKPAGQLIGSRDFSYTFKVENLFTPENVTQAMNAISKYAGFALQVANIINVFFGQPSVPANE